MVEFLYVSIGMFREPNATTRTQSHGGLTFEFEQDPWPVSAVVPFVHSWRFSVGYVLNNDIRLGARDVAYFDVCDKLLLLVL